MAALPSLLAEIGSGHTPWKIACRVVSTTNLMLSTLPIVDDVQLQEGDRVLVAGQSDSKQNGIYLASANAWTRAKDMSKSSYAMLGTTVRILEGTDGGGKRWVLTSPTNGSIRIGVTAMVFAEEAGGGPGGGSPEDVDPTPDTLVLRDNGGSIFATAVAANSVGTDQLYANSSLDITSGADIAIDAPGNLNIGTASTAGVGIGHGGAGTFLGASTLFADVNAMVLDIDTSLEIRDAGVSRGSITTAAAFSAQLTTTSFALDNSGTMAIGTANQTGLTIGRSGAATTISGSTTTLGTTHCSTLTAASGSVNLYTTNVTAISMGRSAATFALDASTCQLIGATNCTIRSPIIYLDGGTVNRRNAAGSTSYVTDTQAATYTKVYSNAVTTLSDSWNQASSGPGGTRTISGQRGAPGSIGGKISIASGQGGINGTNLGGGIDLVLAQAVGGSTDLLSIKEDTTTFLTVRSQGGQSIVAATTIKLEASSIGYNLINGGTCYLDQNSLVVRTYAGSSKRVDTIANAYVQAYDAAVTSVTETLGAASSTRETTWTDGITAARISESHASVTTTDATVTTCGSVTVANDRVAHITAEVTGYSSNTVVASYERKATVRAASGTATMVGSVTSVHTAEDSAGWDCTIDVNAGNARVRVTGAAATTVRWETKLRVVYGK